jgi:hypothetical protein
MNTTEAVGIIRSEFIGSLQTPEFKQAFCVDRCMDTNGGVFYIYTIYHFKKGVYKQIAHYEYEALFASFVFMRITVESV